MSRSYCDLRGHLGRKPSAEVAPDRDYTCGIPATASDRKSDPSSTQYVLRNTSTYHATYSWKQEPISFHSGSWPRSPFSPEPTLGVRTTVCMERDRYRDASRRHPPGHHNHVWESTSKPVILLAERALIIGDRYSIHCFGGCGGCLLYTSPSPRD